MNVLLKRTTHSLIVEKEKRKEKEEGNVDYGNDYGSGRDDSDDD
jgi:hypothetical protein